MGILALTPLAQVFWLARAWRASGAVAWPAPRLLLQRLWGVAVRVVLAAGIGRLVGPVILHASRAACTSGTSGWKPGSNWSH